MAAHQAPPSLGFSRQEHWSGLPFPSPRHESEKWKWSHSVMSYSSRLHGLQPTRLLHPRDFPGKNTGVGCHRLLHTCCLVEVFSCVYCYIPSTYKWHNSWPSVVSRPLFNEWVNRDLMSINGRVVVKGLYKHRYLCDRKVDCTLKEWNPRNVWLWFQNSWLKIEIFGQSI